MILTHMYEKTCVGRDKSSYKSQYFKELIFYFQSKDTQFIQKYFRIWIPTSNFRIAPHAFLNLMVFIIDTKLFVFINILIIKFHVIFKKKYLKNKIIYPQYHTMLVSFSFLSFFNLYTLKLNCMFNFFSKHIHKQKYFFPLFLHTLYNNEREIQSNWFFFSLLLTIKITSTRIMKNSC